MKTKEEEKKIIDSYKATLSEIKETRPALIELLKISDDYLKSMKGI